MFPQAVLQSQENKSKVPPAPRGCLCNLDSDFRPPPHPRHLTGPPNVRTGYNPPWASTGALTFSMYRNRQRKTFKIRTGWGGRGGVGNDSNLLGNQGTQKNKSLKTRSLHLNQQVSGATVSEKPNITQPFFLLERKGAPG